MTSNERMAVTFAAGLIGGACYGILAGALIAAAVAIFLHRCILDRGP